jgi:hypothetical protein
VHCCLPHLLAELGDLGLEFAREAVGDDVNSCGVHAEFARDLQDGPVVANVQIENLIVPGLDALGDPLGRRVEQVALPFEFLGGLEFGGVGQAVDGGGAGGAVSFGRGGG